MLNLINAVLGAALIVAGRKLFWLFVGAVGFIAGIEFTTRIWHGPEGTAILIGVIVGLIFAGLAIFLQAIAIGIAGFLAGGYLLFILASLLGMDKGPLLGLTYIVGGIIGVVLVSFLFDWAVITLSSLIGSSLIVRAFSLQRAADGIIFFVLVIVGVAIQGSAIRNEKRHQSNGR
jgi:hypothetical protein